MIFAKTFFFSLNVLWRFLLVFPIVVLASLAINLIGGIVSIILVIISPPLAIIGMMAICLGSTSAIFVMAAARVALQAKGIPEKNTFGAVLMNAYGYGMIQSVILLFLFVIVDFSFGLISSLSLWEYLLSDEDVLLEELYAESQFAFIAYMIVVFGLMGLVRALLLPSMTAAAVGRDPDRGPHTPLNGLGKNVFPLFIIVGLSAAAFVGGAMAIPHLVGIFGGGTTSADFIDDVNVDLALQDWMTGVNGATVLFLLGGTILYAWMQSIQAAGAAIFYLRRCEDEEAQAALPVVDHQAVSDGAAALWRSRLER